MRTYRSIFKFLVPSWLSQGDGGKVLESLTETLDDNESRERQGLLMRFPSRAQPDALYLIGVDRGIPRGRSEAAAHYAMRLIGWRYPRGHAVRGSAFAALNQISEYFGGIRCWSIDVKGNRHVHEADGSESFSYAYPWTWDTIPAKGRFWFVLNMVGVSWSAPDAAAITALFTGDVPWKPGGTMQQWACLDVEGTIVSPTAAWEHWSANIAGTQTQTRYTGWRYWALDAALKQYAGNPASFCTQYNRPGGGTYAGNAASFPATITLIGGGTYAGNAASFPATITLPDDGDQT